MDNDAPTARYSDHVNFSAPASLRKWPSLGNQRRGEAANPYLVLDGTLGECLRRLTAYAASTRHLYEVHTAPQPPLVAEVMAGETVTELARLRRAGNARATRGHEGVEPAQRRSDAGAATDQGFSDCSVITKLWEQTHALVASSMTSAPNRKTHFDGA